MKKTKYKDSIVYDGQRMEASLIIGFSVLLCIVIVSDLTWPSWWMEGNSIGLCGLRAMIGVRVRSYCVYTAWVFILQRVFQGATFVDVGNYTQDSNRISPTD